MPGEYLEQCFQRLRRLIACLMAASRSRPIILAWIPVLALVGCLVLVARSQAVLGPAGGYDESNGDIIEVCPDAACTSHTTSFAAGDRVYLRLTTRRVKSIGPGSYLRLYNYLNTQVATTNWTQTVGTSPYVYTASIVIPNPSTNYLKVVGYLDRGNNALQFEEQLQLSGLTGQYMKFYSDAAQTDESYTFHSGATIYVSAYGNGGTYSAGSTGNNNRLYDFANTGVNSWAAPAVTQVGNFYNFSLTLPATGLTSGDSYNVRTQLSSLLGTIERMSEMIQIDDTSPTASITDPIASEYIQGTVPVTGTAADTTSFYNYVLEYGAGASPTSWTQIGTTSTVPVNAGTLQNWDTTVVADGLYTLRLTVIDRAYNVSMTTVQVNVDNNAPVISGVNANPVHGTTATIGWTTDKGATSQIEYGTASGSYPYTTTLDTTLVTSHSQDLTGLMPNTTYYYCVISADPLGHTTTSSEYSFTTPHLLVLQPYPALGRDTNIGSSQPAWNWGADEYLRIGDLNTAVYGTLRSLLRFDLSGIPPSATISSATLSLYQVAQGDTTTPTLNLYYLTQDWTEGTGTGSATANGATWNTWDGSSPWAAAGGDYFGTPSTSAAAPDSTGAWVNWTVTALTQSWVNGATANYGMLLRQSVENPAGTDLKRYCSSDYAADSSLRPKLTIEWTGSDTTPPSIGEVQAKNVTRNSADITWSTDENSNSRVEYGTTTSYGTRTVTDTSLVNQHSVPLSGLTENTVYHYRVISSDSSGNTAISPDYVFQTACLLVIQPDPSAGIDTWITSGNPSWNYGAAIDLTAGESGATVDRTLLKFDLSAIPAGSVINSATLSLYQFAQASTDTPQMGVYSMTTTWAEGTGNGMATGDGATWNTSDGASAWTSAGGDFMATPEATALAPATTGTWLDFSIPALAQTWVNSGGANNGVMVKKVAETGVTDFKSFYASGYSADPTLRPKLVIEYVPAPGTITMTVDATFNRDGSAGAGSVDFGSISAGMSYYVGDQATPPYATQLTVQSSVPWGLEVSASGDLVQSNPAYLIDISRLYWKNDSDPVSAYQAFLKSPLETVITSGRPAGNGFSFYFDYYLDVPLLSTSGTYSATLVYTAYPE